MLQKRSRGALLVLADVLEDLLAAHGTDALLVGAALAVETLLVQIHLAHLALLGVGVVARLAAQQFVLPDLPAAASRLGRVS